MLKQSIDAYMADAMPAGVREPLAIIAPHAGYIYSGQICADAYNQVRGRTYDTVVILGTNHTSPAFDKISVYSGAGFETPLGIAAVDQTVVSELLKKSADCQADASVHAREHSVEVQVPFIQVLFPQAKIVPVVVGTADPELCQRFGETLASVLEGRRALIVASTDLSHYPAYRDAVKVDGETLQAITRMDLKALHTALASYPARRIENLHTEACGEAPIMAAMAAAKRLGAKGAKVVSYANSGDVSIGENNRVVGYGAVVFTKETAPPSPTEKASAEPATGQDLPESDKKALLAFTRKTITWFLSTQTVPLARGFSPAVQQPQGVFVTLKKHHDLRGCIGRIIPDDTPLNRLVGVMALQSALNDPRFPAVSLEEMKDIEIELSVLTPIKLVSGLRTSSWDGTASSFRKEAGARSFYPRWLPNRDGRGMKCWTIWP